MIKWLKCLFRGHDFSRIVAIGLETEVRECCTCGKHLSTHSGLKMSFISKPEDSMYPVLINEQKVAKMLYGEDNNLIVIRPLKNDLQNGGEI